MTDLVKRLRERYEHYAQEPERWGMLLEAADRIEQLEAENREYRKEANQFHIEVGCELSEKQLRIEQLEAQIDALEFIVAKHQSQDRPENSESPSLNIPHGQE